MLRMARPRKHLSRDTQRTFRGRFAAHLQAMLDERGWMPHDLARRLKLRPPAIRKWLRADGGPELTLLERLAAALCTRQHPVKDYRDVLPPGAPPVPVRDVPAAGDDSAAGESAETTTPPGKTAGPAGQWTSAETIRRRARKTIEAGRAELGAAGKAKGKARRKKRKP